MSDLKTRLRLRSDDPSNYEGTIRALVREGMDEVEATSQVYGISEYDARCKIEGTRTYRVYTGDGNFGVGFDHEIEAIDLDDAERIYMEGVADHVKDLFDIEHEEYFTCLTVYDGPNGERAYNDGAFFCAEIWDADHDPRAR